MLTSTSVQRTLLHPGLLHGCLVVAACQWAWVTGSLEHVKVPFLYHKAAAYEFAKKQLSESENDVSDTAVFAIATLALTEVGKRPYFYINPPSPGPRLTRCRALLATWMRHRNIYGGCTS